MIKPTIRRRLGRSIAIGFAFAMTVWLSLPGLAALVDEPAQPFGYGRLPKGAYACLGSPRFVCDRPAQCVAFSPDGKLVAAGTCPFDFGCPIHVWSLSTGQEVATLKGHREQVKAVRFTPTAR